jgi:F-type H+-transporting ATPase subunit a
MTNLFILSPLSQFEVTNLIGVNAPILGHINISLTNLALYTIFILLIAIGLHYYGNRIFIRKFKYYGKRTNR